MFKKICLFTNYNQYESKRHFTKKFVEALNRQNIETKVIDANEKVIDVESVKSLHEFAPDFTCSFNSMNPLRGGKFLWDFLKIPHLSFLVDPSFYATDLIESPYSIISCVDRSDCSAIRTSGFENVLFFPHAVERDLAPEKGVERDLDVVFLGSCYDYESLRMAWRARNPEALNKVLDDAIDIVFSTDRLSLAEALVEAWNISKCDPRGVDFPVLYSYLDNYTRGKDRVELIRSITNAKIHVFGELSPDNPVGILGWSQYLKAQSNVTVHPPMPYSEIFPILKRAKIVLNSMPFFRDGTHERIFNALACGGLPVTSESMYLREQFKDGQEMVFYQGSNRGAVNAKVDDFLSNEKKRQEAVMHGRDKVMKHHTWDARVEQLNKELPPVIKKIRAGA